MKLYDEVKIKKTGDIGTIIDICLVKGKPNYTVETEKKHKLIDCFEDEIEPL